MKTAVKTVKSVKSTSAGLIKTGMVMTGLKSSTNKKDKDKDGYLPLSPAASPENDFNPNADPFIKALMNNHVSARIIDVDHYRSGVSVDTDYIIEVQPKKASMRAARLEDASIATGNEFETFLLSKTYNSFRSFAKSLKKAADSFMSTEPSRVPYIVEQLAKDCITCHQLVDSQRTRYLAKVNYSYVKVLARKRRMVISDAVDEILAAFPKDTKSHPFLAEVSSIIYTFFLTDHIDDDGKSPRNASKYKTDVSSISVNTRTAIPEEGDSNSVTVSTSSVSGKPLTACKPVVPLSTKVRRDEASRAFDQNELETTGHNATLVIHDGNSQTLANPLSSDQDDNDTVDQSGVATQPFGPQGAIIGDIINKNPIFFVAFAVVTIFILHALRRISITLDVDILMLLLFATFCMGLHLSASPKPQRKVSTIRKPARPPSRFFRRGEKRDTSGAKLLKKFLFVTSPSGARRASFGARSSGTNLGIHNVEQNGKPNAEDNENVIEAVREVTEDEQFMDSINEGDDDSLIIVGPMEKFPDGAELGSITNCWSEPDHKLFSVRGPNYLSDKKKTQSNTYLFPMRGVDLFLTDLCPENVGSNSSILGGQLRDIPTFLINWRLPWGVLIFYYEIPERFVPYLKASYDNTIDRQELNKKIEAMSSNPERAVARYLLGDNDHRNQTFKLIPRIAQGPWIVKSTVPNKPAIIGTKLPVSHFYAPEEDDKACYLEVDLDIASSSAARSILSVVRSYTQGISVDLGFVIQSNSSDELPEQMLLATRLHGIDPLSAPPLPPMKQSLPRVSFHSEDQDDETEWF